MPKPQKPLRLLAETTDHRYELFIMPDGRYRVSNTMIQADTEEMAEYKLLKYLHGNNRLFVDYTHLHRKTYLSIKGELKT